MITLLHGVNICLSLFAADFPICTVPDQQYFPCAVYENNQYYVFWTDYRSYPLYQLYGSRISESGVVIDTNGKYLCNGILNGNACHPRAAFDGTNFMVVCGTGGC